MSKIKTQFFLSDNEESGCKNGVFEQKTYFLGRQCSTAKKRKTLIPSHPYGDGRWVRLFSLVIILKIFF